MLLVFLALIFYMATVFQYSMQVCCVCDKLLAVSFKFVKKKEILQKGILEDQSASNLVGCIIIMIIMREVAILKLKDMNHS